ncbi:U2 small nuclear ribonucleoprotein auxiliary factor 35 kDa subunit-related protein 2 isoform X2 [Stomoxys calcitrans]|uniref:U2 small nuclear ribonucleoprotein auxiliary factor 35 kDa subunit-related protein 2 isoform X2 n=1 Tax=Stomoxys calcitrans TaxID=35570 RepID=UPI0027E31307|nr:U2 small nuclear ribonucleoprotein auxiliary factor 35 kDa subunit-related protein 2 isoform X2 [Stomoxys calcitrans]
MEAQMKRPRTWRKLVKKLQRKKRRQKLARDRDKKLEEEELQKQNDPSYKQWLEHQEHMEERQRIAYEKEQQENEEQWLRRELLAQKQFQREQQMRLAEEKAQEELREQQYKKLKELEEAKKRQQEERQRKAKEAAKELEETIKICDEYLQDPGMATPTRMQGYIETRPGEKQCEFYKKTQCCRFGYHCSHSHTRPLLSNIILIRNFFQHRLLDQQQHEEYSSAEEQLEMGEGDLRSDYDEFCADVWPELEQFGEIVNFRTARNVQPHARGTVFVEYKDKRSALKAFINLQSRYYAAKRLNVEFAHITHWRTAVCGHSGSLHQICLDGFSPPRV